MPYVTTSKSGHTMTNDQGIICGQRKIACLRVYTRGRCCEALDNVCKIQMLYVVSYMCTIVGVYSCAVDANQCVRGLQRVGCVGAMLTMIPTLLGLAIGTLQAVEIRHIATTFA